MSSSMPALFTRMSIWPQRSMAASTADRDLASSRHVARGVPTPGRRRPRSAGPSPSRWRPVRPTTITSAPSAANARAMARPIPRPPPVTSACDRRAGRSTPAAASSALPTRQAGTGQPSGPRAAEPPTPVRCDGRKQQGEAGHRDRGLCLESSVGCSTNVRKKFL